MAKEDQEEEHEIKPSGTIKPTPVGTAHIPKEIREELEVTNGEAIPFVADAHTVILYNPKTDEIYFMLEDYELPNKVNLVGKINENLELFLQAKNGLNTKISRS